MGSIIEPTIPTLSEVNAAIEEFQNIDLPNIHWSEFHSRLPVLFKGGPTHSFSLDASNIPWIYRIREFDNIEEPLKKTQISEYSYNQEPKLNRANFPGCEHAVFYGATDFKTAYAETMNNCNNFFTLGCWKLVEGHCINSYIVVKNVNHPIKSKFDILIKNILNSSNLNTEQSKGFLRLIEFHQEQFSISNYGKESVYYFSAWFGSLFLKLNSIYTLNDSILYPSCIDPLNLDVNLAISSNILDKGYLKLANIYLLKTFENAFGAIPLCILGIGDIEDSDIKWRDITEEERKYFLKVHAPEKLYTYQ
jgi:hypothetical protein